MPRQFYVVRGWLDVEWIFELVSSYLKISFTY